VGGKTIFGGSVTHFVEKDGPKLAKYCVVETKSLFLNAI
jgi:hypothetical protein